MIFVIIKVLQIPLASINIKKWETVLNIKKWETVFEKQTAFCESPFRVNVSSAEDVIYDWLFGCISVY